MKIKKVVLFVVLVLSEQFYAQEGVVEYHSIFYDRPGVEVDKDFKRKAALEITAEIGCAAFLRLAGPEEANRHVTPTRAFGHDPKIGIAIGGGRDMDGGPCHSTGCMTRIVV